MVATSKDDIMEPWSIWKNLIYCQITHLVQLIFLFFPMLLQILKILKNKI